MHERDDFGPWLGGQLRRCGLTQADFAEKMGVTRAVVSAWVVGRAVPRPEAFQKISAVLGAELERLG
ncbi:helix-turn-helix domain-containing protein [Kitasatospora cineracea]|uniref:helix-turn-helix domain-containing protein n=1 Tax=Kitasatospora cineracea TaxID=88074 RepID=UPI003828A612